MMTKFEFTYAIPCSRCGKPVEPVWDDIGHGQRTPSYEGMRFEMFPSHSFRFALPIIRDDPATQARMREGHPLCDDCMEDLMDWLEGASE